MNLLSIIFICFFVCIFSFPTDDISQVSSGGYFTAVVTKNNEIWLIGYGNQNGGTKVNNTVGINEIVCGGYHCLGLNKENGLVYHLDIVEKQKLENGNYTIQPVLIEPLQDKRIVKIDTGFNHSVAITESGRVYSWGENRNAKLGHRNYPHAEEGQYVDPQLVNIESQIKFKDACCGGDFTLLLDEEGRVWSFGINTNGQLGRDDSVEQNAHIPAIIHSLQIPIEKVFCGGDHSFLLATNGSKVFSFGWGEKGQLGHGSFEDEREPRLLTSLKEGEIVKDISATGYGHTIILNNDNKVYTCGWNEYQQLGTNHQADLSVPTLILGLDGVASIKNNRGFKHTCFLMNTNKVIAMGDNEHGQIELGNHNLSEDSQKLLATTLENALAHLKDVKDTKENEKDLL